jgi:ferritin-like protein
MTSEGFHEQLDKLRPETLDHHRAIVSLMEELEAVDWYAQRVDATDDESLAEILAHNRDEEKEHAAMLLEWLRRRDPVLDENLRTYLFTEGPIVGIEAAAESGGDDDAAAEVPAGDGSLGVGDLRAKDLPTSRPLPD